MADDVTDEVELKLEAPKAGLAFRAEMWAMDALLGYWPYVAGVVGLALVVIFFYGQYVSWERSTQQSLTREVARVEAKMKVPPAEVAFAAAQGAPIPAEDLVASATRLEGVSGSGAGRVEALLKAGELYRVAGRPDDARRVFAEASATASGPLRALAESALASVEIGAGDVDGAARRLDALAQGGHGFLSQEAALTLGALHEQGERPAEARAVYERFLTQWPESPRKNEVEARLQGLGEGG